MTDKTIERLGPLFRVAFARKEDDFECWVLARVNPDGSLSEVLNLRWTDGSDHLLVEKLQVGRIGIGRRRIALPGEEPTRDRSRMCVRAAQQDARFGNRCLPGRRPSDRPGRGRIEKEEIEGNQEHGVGVVVQEKRRSKERVVHAGRRPLYVRIAEQRCPPGRADVAGGRSGGERHGSFLPW